MVRPEDEMPAAKKKDKQLMEDAKKADAAAEEHRDTPEKKRARMEELVGAEGAAVWRLRQAVVQRPVPGAQVAAVPAGARR